MISSMRFRNSGRKVSLQAFVDLLARLAQSIRSPSRRKPIVPAQILGADVRGHDDHGVAEIDRVALPVGQAPVVQHLQQRVEDIRVRLLDLVEQHHLVGPPPHASVSWPPSS